MDIKNSFKNFFTYKPQKSYVFSISEKENNNVKKQTKNNNENNNTSFTNIENNIYKNLDYIKSAYNALINSDIVIREFTLNARNQQYHAFLFYIDGMIDTNIMNDFILKPLMLKNQSNSL